MIVRTAAIGVIQSALAAVEAERQFINDLNVYPVPDGDTGTNMALTVRAVVEELEQSDVTDIPSVAAAVTKGSLMGARGNSGVILSQIVRGICDVWGQANSLDTAVFKRAVLEGQHAAYRAVKTPVEGTMLTVIREMATAAQAVPDGLGLEHLLAAVEEAGRIAVENTTAPAAGPAEGRRRRRRRLRPARAVPRPRRRHRGPHARRQGGRRRARRGARRGRCVHRAVAAGRPRAVSRRGAERALRVPLLHELPHHRRGHRPRGVRGVPAAASATARWWSATSAPSRCTCTSTTRAPCSARRSSTASIGDIEINDMHAQTRERDERLAAAAARWARAAPSVVAVVAGAGNQQLFRDLGCHAIVDGGQSMNPSAAQLLKAVEELGVDEVVILPNNGNVILTAEQAAGMSSLHIAVVPSRSIPSGLAAMVAFDPAEDAVGNARAMQDAIVDVRYAEVTRAVRDSELDGLEVKQGQAMAIVDGRLVAAADDIVAAFGGVLEEFAGGGAEYVTVLTALNGSGTTREQLEELAARVAPDAEVSFHEGGQPLYPILASAE